MMNPAARSPNTENASRIGTKMLAVRSTFAFAARYVRLATTNSVGRDFVIEVVADASSAAVADGLTR